MGTAKKMYKNDTKKEISMTPSLTPFMKKSIPTLVLLTIVVLLSGCVGAAIDRALQRATEGITDLVTDIFPDIDIEDKDINSIEGVNTLGEDDPCLDADKLFNDPFLQWDSE